MGEVQLEVMASLAPFFGARPSGRVVLSETIQERETVRELLNRLAGEHEGFDRMVFDTATQQLTGHVRLVLNGRLIELVEGLDTCLEDGDSLLFLPAFSGG